MAVCEAAIISETHPGENVATKAFGKTEPLAGWRGCRIGFGAHRAGRQLLRDLIDQGKALLDLTDADPDAGVDVTLLEHGDLESEPVIRSIAWALSGIESP